MVARIKSVRNTKRSPAKSERRDTGWESRSAARSRKEAVRPITTAEQLALST